MKNRRTVMRPDPRLPPRAGTCHTHQDKLARMTDLPNTTNSHSARLGVSLTQGDEAMPMREYLDRPPAGWFALDVMRKEARKWDWVALMIDVHPDELKHCLCTTAFLYVRPSEYRPDRSRTAREAWVRIPGKHRNRDAAWDALEDMIATRH
jgi:hypothetical protein